MTRTGGRPVISAERAFAHVDALLAECPGLSRRHIARLAGLSESGLSVASRTMRIEPDTEERILAVQARHVRLMPPPQMPASIAREHVAALMDETGVARLCIARAAGVNYQTVYNVMKPEKPIVKWRVHHAIMTTSVEDVRAAEFWTERWPSTVRLRALQANQWSLHRLGEQWGMNLSTHANAALDSPIEAAVARRIKALYEHLGDEVGPSVRSRIYAERLGFKAPIHYDEDMRLAEEPSEDERAQHAARVTLCVLGQTIENRSVEQITGSLGILGRTVSAARRNYGLTIGRTIDGGYEAVETVPGAVAAIREAVKRVHYRSTLDVLDEPGLDYVTLLATLAPEAAAVAA